MKKKIASISIPPFVKIMLLLGVLFGAFFGVGAGVSAYMQYQADEEALIAEEGEEETEEEEVDFPTRMDGKRTNILLLGVDAREGETNSRTDTMILVSVDPKLNRAAVVSIPRDTRVKVKGSTVKINEANYYGGPKLAVSTVEELMNTKIDYYVEMDFAGFKNIIDIIGGVEYDVPQRMYKPAESIDLQQGLQTLDGYKALALVRFRDYNQGDIQRTAVQQDFIKALTAKALQPMTLVKLPKIAREVSKNVNTNLKLTDMIKMISWAPGFTSDSVTSTTLPGNFYDERDVNGYLTASYWEADKNQAARIIDDMFGGKEVAVFHGSSSTYTQPDVAQQEGMAEDEEAAVNGSSIGYTDDVVGTDGQEESIGQEKNTGQEETAGQESTQNTVPADLTGSDKDGKEQIQPEQVQGSPENETTNNADDGHGLINEEQPGNTTTTPADTTEPGNITPTPTETQEPPAPVDPYGPEGYV